MTKERLLEFLEKNVFSKYRYHLIVSDNDGSHNNELIKMRLQKVSSPMVIIGGLTEVEENQINPDPAPHSNNLHHHKMIIICLFL